MMTYTVLVGSFVTHEEIPQRIPQFCTLQLTRSIYMHTHTGSSKRTASFNLQKGNPFAQWPWISCLPIYFSLYPVSSARLMATGNQEIRVVDFYERFYLAWLVREETLW